MSDERAEQASFEQAVRSLVDRQLNEDRSPHWLGVRIIDLVQQGDDDDGDAAPPQQQPEERYECDCERCVSSDRPPIQEPSE